MTDTEKALKRQVCELLDCDPKYLKFEYIPLMHGHVCKVTFPNSLAAVFDQQFNGAAFDDPNANSPFILDSLSDWDYMGEYECRSRLAIEKAAEHARLLKEVEELRIRVAQLTGQALEGLPQPLAEEISEQTK